MGRLYARAGVRRFEPDQLDDPLEFERPLLAAEMAMGDEHQFPIGPADMQRLNHALGAALAGIEVLHHDRFALLQRLFQFQRQEAFPRSDGEQPHRTALLADGIAQAQRPPADRRHELFKHGRGRLGIGQRAVGN